MTFIRACKNGFKGFLEWFRSLLKQDGRHLDDVLEDIEQKPIGGKGAIGKGIVIGKYSKRPFNPENAGGPILNLKWDKAKVTQEGIETVKKHLSRFEPDEWNNRMIDRLEKIERDEINISDFDKRFYTHEIREYERYTILGHENTTWKNLSEDEFQQLWNDTHAATLEDYKIYEKIDYKGEKVFSLYHPDVQF